MRALATGDWHVGAGADYGREAGDRLRDQEQVLEQIVDLALEREIDAFLIAGDVWHRRRPTPAELLAVARPLRRLRSESACEIVAIAGNHCVETAELPVALDLFTDAVAVHRQPGVVMTTVGAIAVLPWTPISRLVAARNGGDRDSLVEEAAALLITLARGLRDEIPADVPAVLMLHWSVSDAALPTGISSNELREVVLSLDDLIALEFDAIVCSHLHRQQVLSELPFIAYTGSPLPVDFAEANVEHGVLLLETA